MRGIDLKILFLKPNESIACAILTNRGAYYLIEDGCSSFLQAYGDKGVYVHSHKRFGDLEKWRNLAEQLRGEINWVWQGVSVPLVDIETAEFSARVKLMSVLLLPDWPGLSSLPVHAVIRSDKFRAVVYGGSMAVYEYVECQERFTTVKAIVDLPSVRKILLEMKKARKILHYVQFCLEEIISRMCSGSAIAPDTPSLSASSWGEI